MATKRKTPSNLPARKTASTSTTSNNEAMIEINIEAFLTPIAIFIGSLMISFSILYSAGRLVSGDSILGAADSGNDTVDSGDTADAAPPTVVAGKTTIDDDPILGDKSKAKVAIIEFSDYECPFCKRHFQQTHESIVKDFVDTGKAILVFRDFPLSFHDPLATKEAMAGECVDELGGDAKYYQYHDKVFNATNSNGEGLDTSKLYTFASEVGVNSAKFKDCLDSEKYKEEIQSDIADGSAAGIDGTPGFIIGVLDKEGNVDGVVVSGAQAYATFKSTIEDQLAKAQ